MPKVNADYFEKRKSEILDAAYRVCMRKPMHGVSMRDIISESGCSQGKIYRYFSNIDDLLIELINQKSTYYNVEIKAEDIIANGSCPEKVISELFLLWKKAFLDNLTGVGKIYYELSTLYANDPDRLNNFISKSTLSLEQNIFQEKSFSYVIKKIQEGYFHPKLPIEDILKFLITACDGITRDLILAGYYKMKDCFPIIQDLNGNTLTYSLCVSFILLLGGNEKLINGEEFYDGLHRKSETI